MVSPSNKIIFMAWVLVLILVPHCASFDGPEIDEARFESMRKDMVSRQIIARGIEDKRLIDALLKVPRHRFVPLAVRFLSYNDSPLPIGEGQTISQPYVVALMTELLDLNGTDKVLEIGTGSGYQAAVLAELAKEIYTVEIVESLSEKAERLLQGMGYKNIKVKCADGYLGWEEFSPFDAIIVTCAPPDIPEELFNQLKDGGRMVVPVGIGEQKLLLITKEKGKQKIRNVTPVRFVPMVKGQ